MSTLTDLPRTQDEWRAALESLPATPDNIPAFFFGHGSPMLQWPDDVPTPSMGGRNNLLKHTGPDGPLARFLSDFGPALLEKYKPKGILVFSAHWETSGERLGEVSLPNTQHALLTIYSVHVHPLTVTDYGDNQPLLMDYFGFHPSLYKLKFESSGDSSLSQRVVDAFTEAGLPARTTPVSEPRGKDGRGFAGPGLDHGVFIPFRLMFGHSFKDVPIVQASIDGSLSPEANWEIGKAVARLRYGPSSRFLA